MFNLLFLVAALECRRLVVGYLLVLLVEVDAAHFENDGLGGRCHVFWVCQRDTGEEAYKVDLDAMLAAQDTGIPTLNGYSGWSPPQYELTPFAREKSPPYPFYRLKQ